jgi:hypothetical protein
MSTAQNSALTRTYIGNAVSKMREIRRQALIAIVFLSAVMLVVIAIDLVLS